MPAAELPLSSRSLRSLRLERLLRLAVVGYWFFLACVLAARWSVWIELASHFVWQALLGGAALLVVLAMRRQWRLAIAVVMPLGYLLFLFQPWLLWQQPAVDATGSPGKPPVHTQRLKVMSWNVLCVNQNVAEIQRVIAANPVDVLVLVEVRPNLFEQIPELERQYPYRLAYPSWGGNGIAVLTHREDVRLARQDFGGSNMPSIVATLPQAQLGQDQSEPKQLAIVGMHTWSPFPPQRAVARDRQLADMVSWLSQQKSPVCVVGDLNITPWAPAFAEMRRVGLVDSRDLGFGNSASWPAWLGPLGIPIDHALSYGQCQITRRQLGPMVFGSDHRPVLVEIAY